MKKKADIFLPKGKEAKNVEFKLVDGKIEVSYDVEDIFNPKDGDFLVNTSSGAIIIYKKIDEEDRTFAYAGVHPCELDDVLYAITTCGWGNINHFRPATKEEKAKFLYRLKKEYKKIWNEKKKCCEDIYSQKEGNIVRIELKDTFRTRNYMIAICPNQEEHGCDTRFCSPYISVTGELVLDGEGFAINYYNISPASESEKQELFDKLAEVGKRWNPETKQIEDIRWIPQKNEEFWYINEDLIPIWDKFLNKNTDHISRIKSNNCFKTSKAAKKVADQIKEIFKNSKVE